MMETNIAFDFKLDEEALELRGTADTLSFDKEVALALIKGNTIGFTATKEEKMVNKESGKTTGIHLAYRLTAQAAMHCHFEEVSSTVNLENIGAIVRDMEPGEAKEGDAVKETHKSADGITFKFLPLPITATTKEEVTKEMDVYKTEIIAFGMDRRYARWAFRQPVNRELRIDRVLQLLAELQEGDDKELAVDITLRFIMRADNVLGSIPFWGRKKIMLHFIQTI